MLLVAIVAGLAFSRSKGGMMLASSRTRRHCVAIALQAGPCFHPGGSRIGQRATLAVLGFAAIFTVLFGLGRLPHALKAIKPRTFEAP